MWYTILAWCMGLTFFANFMMMPIEWRSHMNPKLMKMFDRQNTVEKEVLELTAKVNEAKKQIALMEARPYLERRVRAKNEK